MKLSTDNRMLPENVIVTWQAAITCLDARSPTGSTLAIYGTGNTPESALTDALETTREFAVQLQRMLDEVPPPGAVE